MDKLNICDYCVDKPRNNEEYCSTCEDYSNNNKSDFKLDINKLLYNFQELILLLNKLINYYNKNKE